MSPTCGIMSKTGGGPATSVLLPWTRLSLLARSGCENCRQRIAVTALLTDQTPEVGIALLPAYRGKGLGSALLEALFEAAKEIYPAISLSVSIDNPARRLYERMGLAPVRQEGDSLTMLKHLGKQQNETFRQGTRLPGPAK